MIGEGAALDRQAVIEGLATLQEHTKHHRQLVDDVRKVVLPYHQPAKYRITTLSSAKPIRPLTDKGAKSFTVFNPYGITIFAGVAGLSADNVEAIPVPQQSWVTVPIGASDLEIGAAAADLAAGDAVVHVFLYDTVQPFAAGTLS